MKQPLPMQAKQLHQALTHLVQQYQCRDRNDICCYGISVSQCHTLEALGEHGTQTMHDLAEHLHLAVSTVTRVVDQLVDKGLAERHSGVKDRRVCEVALTPRGRELLSTIQGELIAREQAVLARIPAASRAHVIWAIEALSTAVDEWRKTVAQDG
jgi:MarR family 2-MHQ and catechol resistance regulon transcriptional repressor